MDGKTNKARFSVVDICALVIILIVAAALVFRFTSRGTTFSANNKIISYSVKINGVRDFTYDYYETGLKCFDRQTNKEIGVIKAVRQEPYTQLVTLDDGSIKEFEQPGIIAIHLDIEAYGNESDTAYYANGTYEIKAGSEIFLTTKYVEVISTVTDVSAR